MSLDEKSSWVHSVKTSKDEDLGFIYEVLDVGNVKDFIKELKEGKLKIFSKSVGCIRNEIDPDNCSCIGCVRKSFFNLMIKEIDGLAGPKLT